MGCNASTGQPRPRNTLNNSNHIKYEPVESKTRPVVTISTEDNQVLTDGEKNLIRQTWTILSRKNKEQLGKIIFLHIFQKHPVAKTYFPFRDVEENALLDNKDFIAHAFRFVQIIESHVVNLDNLRTNVIPILTNLGRFHARHGDWFSAQNFELFMESILLTWEEELGSKFTPEARSAWETLLDFLVQGMTEGFNTRKETKVP